MCHVLWNGLSGNVCFGLLVLFRYSSGLAWISNKSRIRANFLFEIQGLPAQVLIQIELMPLKSCTGYGDAEGTGTELSSCPIPAGANIPHMDTSNCAGAAHCYDPITPS